MGMYFLLTRKIKISLEYASPIAMELSILSKFILNNFMNLKIGK